MCKVRFKERLFILLFALFLAIYPPTVKYQEVQALEWVAPAIGFETALKFLLGLLGVGLTSKVVDDNVDWGEVRQNCVNFQIQQGNDAVAVSKWWDKVISGTLDQASECWTSFKEWVKSLSSNSGSIDTGNAIINKLVSYTYADYNINISNIDVSSVVAGAVFVKGTNSSIFLFKSSGNIELVGTSVKFTNFAQNVFSTSSISGDSIVFSTFRDINFSANYKNYDALYYYGLAGVNLNDRFFEITSLDVSDNDSIFNPAHDNVEDVALTTDTTTDTAIPDTIPLPWDNVADTVDGIADSIDSLQELVAEGVLSLEDYWARVQEMLNVIAFDTTTDETLPVKEDPDTGEPEKLEDIAIENTSNVGFTLAGLEKVFPFCIPWDIKAFVTLLVAEPVAPKIEYPFYNPVTKEDIIIEIDFSQWETVVILFRYILDFLLIIGLLLLARSLAGAGGDD